MLAMESEDVVRAISAIYDLSTSNLDRAKHTQVRVTFQTLIEL